MVMSLNNFNEESWSILHWLRKYLQQVSVFIKINQDFIFLKKKFKIENKILRKLLKSQLSYR